MVHYEYKTEGIICPKKIEFDIEDNIVYNIKYTGGCSGNLRMVSKLLEGKTVDEIISLALGNPCGGRPTSCADQLAQALLKYKNGEL